MIFVNYPGVMCYAAAVWCVSAGKETDMTMQAIRKVVYRVLAADYAGDV